MALVLADRVRDTTTTTGTGTVTLSGTAPTGYQNFSVIGNANTTYYTINAGSQWEVGIGTYSATGPTLSRDTVLESSNANALVNFSAGTKDVFVTYPSDKAVTTDGVETLTNKTINGSNNTITNVSLTSAVTGTLPVANGGTGVTTSTGTGSVVLSNSPVLVTPTLGVASATSIATGLGAVGTPSHTFTGDLNTGMWSPAADTIAFSTNGSERMRIASDGTMQLSVGGVSNTHQFLYNESGGEIQLIDSTGAGPILLDNISGLARFLKVGSGSMVVGTTSTGTLRFQTVDAERMRIDSSGNVGIGTTAPLSALTVVQPGSGYTSQATFKGTIQMAVGPASLQATGGLEFLTSTFSNGYGWKMSSIDSSGVHLVFGNRSDSATWTERMRIDSDGDVGIGTSAPATKLDVNGGVTANENFFAATGGVWFNAANTFTRGIAQAGSDVNFYTSGTERMRIDASGNVGIGTTNPAGYRLRVVGSSGAAQFRAGTDTNGYLEVNAFDSAPVYCVVAGANATAGVFGTQANIPTILFTNNTERMRVDTSGNVGIGTTGGDFGRSWRLVARQDQNAITNTGVINTNTGASAAAQISKITGTGNSFVDWGLVDNSGSPYDAFSYGSAVQYVSWGFGGAERFRITSAGNVGIGTTAPGASTRLNVAGRGLFTAGSYDPGDSTASGVSISYDTGSNVGIIGAVQTGVTEREMRMRGNTLTFFTNGANERMRIDSSGNVGIGTSGPSTRLHVRQDQNGTTAALIQNRNGAGSPASALQFISGAFDLSDNRYAMISSAGGSNTTLQFWTGQGAAPVERMRITDAGNVGIGVTSPPQLLAVGNATDQVGAGVSGAVSTVYFGSPSTGSGGIRRLAYDRATGNFDFIGGGVVDPSTQMTITSTGNVGIGTTSPGAKLDVVGVSLTRTDSSGGSTPLIVRNDSSANNTTKSTGLLFQGVDTVGTGKNTGVVQCGPSDANYVTSFLAFQTRTADALNERMRINSDGQLLVGTTSGGRTVCINAADNWIRQSNPSRSWLIGPSVSTSYTIYDETAGAARFTIDTAGVWNGPNSISLGAGLNNDNRIEVGTGRTGNNFAYIDLIGDTTYTDYGMRMIRGNGGANASSEINHRGTGDFILNAVDAAALRFLTSGTERMRFDSAGTSTYTGLLVGRSSASTDVNTANDTGSFSVRGSTTTIASMSFHRTGAYAINMGLGTDNVFRIGGWSASSNCFQMDGSGNLTMLGNVTAYSDARMKKDVETIDSALDLVSKMRGVRYTRTDTQQRGVGVIAQEMLEVCPEVVQQGIGSDDTLSVAYGNLVGVLIEAIKELRAEVAELKGK
jgi:hypothetical protein